MRVVERLRRDPGLALALLALVAAVALYAPTLRRGLVNYDDPWLVRDNWIVQQPSLQSIGSVFFDLSEDTRTGLGAEYLPVRDVSYMIDVAVWGDTYAGFHLTNLVLYLAALALWFFALAELGIDRRVCGLAVLLWAVHPTHAESVAWIAERKGVLALALAGIVALAHARFRAGRSTRWLALAVVAAAAAVWSKALAAFSIAALGGLELALPANRASLRRAVTGLAVIALATVLAFVPVLVVASRMSVVGDVLNPGDRGWLAMVVGVHGFYVRLAMMATPNAISYPIDTDGPSMADIALGASWLIVVLAVAALPRLAGWSPPRALRAAALIWLVGWFPASRIVLPVRLVVAADRYLLFPTLGLALAISIAVCAVPRRSMAVALAAALVISGAVRTLAAQASWASPTTLWANAVASNPRDGVAWSQYVESLVRDGDSAGAEIAALRGLAFTNSPRVRMHRALLLLRRGDRAAGRTEMELAATQGEASAMANLALLLLEDGDRDAALRWARQAIAAAPIYPNGQRVLGKAALATGHPDEARTAFARAVELEPLNLENRFNLALALLALGRHAEARVQLEACLASPALAPRARAELARLPP